MADSYKRLGAVAPSDSYEKVLYSTAAGKSALVSNITVTNRGTEDQVFSINVYDSLVTANELEPVTGPVNAALQIDNYQAAYDVVAVSSNGGVSWSSINLPGAGQQGERLYPSKIAYGNGCYVIAPKYGEYYYSSTDDGATFQALASPRGYSGVRIFFLNGQFIMTPDYLQGSDVFHVSPDGVNWSSVSVPDFGGFQFYDAIERLTYGAGLYLLLPGSPWGSTYLTSPDLQTWTARSLPGTIASEAEGTTPVVYANGKFTLVSGSDGEGAAYISTSSDGITWSTPNTSIPSDLWTGISSNGTSYVSSYGRPYWYQGNGYLYSANGTTWTQGTFPISAGKWDVSWNGQKYVAIPSWVETNEGNTDVALYSTDGVTWTSTSLPSSAKWSTSLGVESIVKYDSPLQKSIYKNVTILANETEILEPGIALDSENTIVVSASNSLTVSAFGVELDLSDKYKILGQGMSVSAGAEETVYEVPPGKQALIRSIVASNVEPAPDNFDISICADSVTATADIDKLFLNYQISGNESITIKAGYTVQAGNTIRIKSANASVNFTIFGVEL